MLRRHLPWWLTGQAVAQMHATGTLHAAGDWQMLRLCTAPAVPSVPVCYQEAQTLLASMLLHATTQGP